MADYHKADLITSVPQFYADKDDVYGGDEAARSIGSSGLQPQPLGDYIPVFRSGLKPAYQIPVDHHRADLLATYGDDNLFHRVWVSPLDIDSGFITEDVVYEIKIWNAWISEDVDFTNVGVIAQDGTALTYPGLPYTITRTNSIILDLDVFKDGPPNQDTQYSLTINGIVYYIEIEGTRVIAVTPDIQWANSSMFKYTFITIMYQDMIRFQEQRRPLVEIPPREISVVYQLEGNSANTLFNTLSYGHDKVFGVPIYNEKLIPTDLTVDGNVITLSAATPTTYLYNLVTNASYVIIVDHVSELAEIKEISSVGANSITLVKDIIETFDLQSTYVYPVLISIVKSAKFSELTDNVEILTIDFMELIV